MRPERPEPVQALLRKDGFGGIVACDDTITEVLGWSSADLVGKRSLDFIHAEDHDPTIALWMELLERPDSVQVVSYRHSHADGTWFHVEVTNRNLLETEGVVECSLVVLAKAEGESADDRRLSLTYEFTVKHDSRSTDDTVLKGHPGCSEPFPESRRSRPTGRLIEILSLKCVMGTATRAYAPQTCT